MKSQFPEIAAFASTVEAFKMSKREVEKRFTKSEIMLVAWRSSEISYKMKLRMAQSAGSDGGHVSAPVEEELPDLSKMTSKQLLAHLANNCGIVFPGAM